MMCWFTFVGAGKAGACHDVAVLSDCQRDPRFPHPPPGEFRHSNDVLKMHGSDL
jgi:hypothetical protein